MADDGLDIFRLVAGCGNNAAVARSLHKDPSRISRAISDLEKNYNTKLFDRSSKPLTLTDSGLFLANMIDNGLSTEQKLKRFVKEKSTRHIKLAFSYPFSWNTLARKIVKLKLNDPDIMFLEGPSDKTQIRNLLFESQLDLALLPDRLYFRDYKIMELLSGYEWGVAVPSGVPVTDKPYVEPYDLEMMPLLMPMEKTCADAIAGWFKDSEICNHADIYNSMSTMIGMINAGFGCAFMPKAEIPALGNSHITFYPCYPKLTTPLYVYTRWNKDMSEELKTFLLSPDGQII